MLIFWWFDYGGFVKQDLCKSGGTAKKVNTGIMHFHKTIFPILLYVYSKQKNIAVIKSSYLLESSY